MKVYRFKVVSAILWISIFLGGFFVGMLIIFSLLIEDEYLFVGFLLIGILIPCVYYLAENKSKAEVEIRLNDQGIECYWIKQFLFHNKQNVYLEWSAIESYIYEPHRYNESLLIKTYGGYFMRLVHTNDMIYRDGFRAFKNAFERKAKELNALHHSSTFIQKRKNFYEKPLGFFFACLTVPVVLYGLFLLFTKPVQNPLLLSFSITNIMFYILQVYDYYRKRKRPR